MTIETASPAGAESLAALFDKLVSDVSAKVLERLDASIAAHVAHAVDSRAEAMIEYWADNHFDDRASTWAQVHLDINDDIDRYVRNELDVSDLVRDAVQDLSFEVTVS